jgi:purine-binding chemotaxis protein CheW
VAVLLDKVSLANKKLEAEEDTMKGRYLTFPILGESYGLEIKYVTQIIGIQRITEMPEMPYYMKGIINLRGQIIPVIDIRLRFGKVEKDYDDRTCVIIVELHNTQIGLITDSISEVMTIADEEIEPLRCFNASQGYIQGIGKTESSIILLIDCKKLLIED